MDIDVHVNTLYIYIYVCIRTIDKQCHVIFIICFYTLFIYIHEYMYMDELRWPHRDVTGMMVSMWGIIPFYGLRITAVFRLVN